MLPRVACSARDRSPRNPRALGSLALSKKTRHLFERAIIPSRSVLGEISSPLNTRLTPQTKRNVARQTSTKGARRNSAEHHQRPGNEEEKTNDTVHMYVASNMRGIEVQSRRGKGKQDRNSHRQGKRQSGPVSKNSGSGVEPRVGARGEERRALCTRSPLHLMCVQRVFKVPLNLDVQREEVLTVDGVWQLERIVRPADIPATP